MHNSTDESQARRVSAKSEPGSGTFQTKHSCLRLFGGDRKNVDGRTRVARALSPFQFPLLRQIETEKNCKIVRLSFSREENTFETSHGFSIEKIKKKKKKKKR